MSSLLAPNRGPNRSTLTRLRAVLSRIGRFRSSVAAASMLRRLRGRERVLARRLAQEQRRAEEMEALVRQRTELIMRISHELRTPLNLIPGYAELMAEGARPLPLEELPEVAAEVRRASATMLRLVDDLGDCRGFRPATSTCSRGGSTCAKSFCP